MIHKRQCGRNVYVPGEEEDVSWLGNFLGKNSYVKELVVKTSIDDHFYKGLSCNKSIQKINFLHIDLSDGQIFQVLNPFKRNQNNNLNEISINNCTFGAEGALQLSVALGSFNNEFLKQIILSHNQIGEGQMNNIFTALGMQTELEILMLRGMNIGRNECVTLSTIIRWGVAKLQRLSLPENNIDDESVQSLIPAICGSKLVHLTLSRNSHISLEGIKSLSTLLERSDSNLKYLFLRDKNIGDDGALVFAAALTNNSALKTLSLMNSGITSKEWSLFSKLLCDTSSPNSTYLSNHTLCDLGDDIHPVDIVSSLTLNCRSIDKGGVAMTKILKDHSHINVQPFFEWEFKVLPVIVTWFAKTAACGAAACIYFEERIKVIKLNAIYDFVREMPMLVGYYNMHKLGKRRSDRLLGSKMSTGSMFDNPEDNTICNCSCVVS